MFGRSEGERNKAMKQLGGRRKKSYNRIKLNGFQWEFYRKMTMAMNQTLCASVSLRVCISAPLSQHEGLFMTQTVVM